MRSRYGVIRLTRLVAAVGWLCSLIVLAFWFYVTENLWVMDCMTVFPLFFAVCFGFAPVSWISTVFCALRLYQEGLRCGWLAVTYLAAGGFATLVNGWCFSYYIAPGC